ncbi:transcriptional regulator, Spx/MgsR family [Formivibrio citricus]|uniref:Transcriptional regulator, Spx/MgsR family n=1 Tax=Formivibrio citricus TaxID=83765 RepID=A0A1I4X6Z0_9NEIS|nr:ArsC family reductase [Formivibrio citricus]SFN21475.1 transcriptional regulator, Spx/MgsR family [Formivibrio citricus]
MKLYGITNCTTVKKARAWLDEHVLAYEFHDFKKSGMAAELLEAWIEQCGWELLLNRRGTTWRKLDTALQANIVDANSAKAVMLAHPSIIKRPILDKDGRIYIGFKPEQYETLFR